MVDIPFLVEESFKSTKTLLDCFAIFYLYLLISEYLCYSYLILLAFSGKFYIDFFKKIRIFIESFLFEKEIFSGLSSIIGRRASLPACTCKDTLFSCC